MLYKFSLCRFFQQRTKPLHILATLGKKLFLLTVSNIVIRSLPSVLFLRPIK